MTTIIELYQPNFEGKLLSTNKGDPYPIPTDIILSDEEDVLSAAEYAFTHWNTNTGPREPRRSMSVGDYINIVNLDDGIGFILRCDNSGWSMLHHGQWEEI